MRSRLRTLTQQFLNALKFIKCYDWFMRAAIGPPVPYENAGVKWIGQYLVYVADPALAPDANGRYSGMWGATGFAPIGYRSSSAIEAFTGTFHGKGFTISNLTIDRFPHFSLGLFNINDGIIQNVGLVNVNITGSANGDAAGVLVGYNRFGMISQSYSTGTVRGAEILGGLVGITFDNSIITQSFSAVDVMGGSFSTWSGGLAGTNYGTISDSYATGGITTGRSGIGGLVGANFGTIIRTYAIGSVSGSSSAGGLVGVNFGGGTTHSYWDTQTSGQATSAGGTSLTTQFAKTQSSYVSWDFANIWGLNSSINNGYPYLRWQTASAPPPTPTPTPTPSPTPYAPGPSASPSSNPSGYYYNPINLIKWFFLGETAYADTQTTLITNQPYGLLTDPNPNEINFVGRTIALPQLSNIKLDAKNTNADTSVINNLITALGYNPSDVYQNGYIGEASECVALVQALSPYKIGATSTWLPWGSVGPDSVIAPGTPIATFENGKYPQDWTLSDGASVHAAIYLGPAIEGGKVVGMYILDQNTLNNSGKAEVRKRKFNNSYVHPYSVIAPSVLRVPQIN